MPVEVSCSLLGYKHDRDYGCNEDANEDDC
ncbi:MAG: hypothetical protein ACI9J0_004267 [Cryomorphaceae bacterium]